MLTKENIQKVLDSFPNEGEIDVDTLIQKIFVIQDIDKSEQDIKDGKIYTSEEMLKRIEQWQK
jgi:Zn-dependent alcohol dehydrogenase